MAMEVIGLLLPKLSEALRRENMARASGKLGGVAGVLAGVHIWKQRENQCQTGTGNGLFNSRLSVS